jgi:uncharacterized membrane protein
MAYVFYTIIGALFFSLTFYFRKQATKTVTLSRAFLVEALTELIILFLFFLTVGSGGKLNFSFLKDKGIIYAVLAGLSVTAGVGLNYLALKSGLMSKVAAINGPANVIFGVLIGVILLADFLTIKQIMGIILAVVGIIFITLK